MKSLKLLFVLIFLFSPSLIFASDYSGVTGFFLLISIASIVIVIALIVAVFNISTNTKLINMKMKTIVDYMEYFAKLKKAEKTENK
jgi:uncharacterized protein YybS (DUF2232 family)